MNAKARIHSALRGQDVVAVGCQAQKSLFDESQKDTCGYLARNSKKFAGLDISEGESGHLFKLAPNPSQEPLTSCWIAMVSR